MHGLLNKSWKSNGIHSNQQYQQLRGISHSNLDMPEYYSNYTWSEAMRMWMVDPKKMCRQHLLGEHVELHMFVSAINKGMKLQAFADNNFLDTRKIKSRHSAIVKEMKRRGYNHKSPLLYSDKLKIGHVDSNRSYKDLLKRCKECRKLR